MRLDRMKAGETAEQIKLFDWARMNQEYIPELELLFHVPNEGKRANGNVLAAMGMKKGVPDIFLPVAKRGYHGLVIEMKYGKNRTSEAQYHFLDLLQQQGWHTAVCYTFEQARDVIRHYLARSENFDLVNCENAPKMFHACTGVSENWAPCPVCDKYINR